MMAAAVEQLLRATGLDPRAPDLAATPSRVAALWATEFLAGYEMDPKQILAETVTGEADPAVIVLNDISFHSLCPHHLLPYQGRAHVAYIPQGRLLGFGQLARLVACFTQRLTLQERATHQVATALLELLPSRGAACVMEARQMCLAIPKDRHRDNRVITCAFLGEFEQRPELRQQLLQVTNRPA
jgi:GTP cyclohydrolase I